MKKRRVEDKKITGAVRDGEAQVTIRRQTSQIFLSITTTDSEAEDTRLKVNDNEEEGG